MSDIEACKYQGKIVVFNETNGLSKIETGVEYLLLPWCYCGSYAYRLYRGDVVVARHFEEQIDELIDSGKGVVKC